MLQEHLMYENKLEKTTAFSGALSYPEGKTLFFLGI